MRPTTDSKARDRKKAIYNTWRRICRRGTGQKGYVDSGLWEFLSYVYTKDSHDPDNPEKLLPVSEKTYLQIVFLYLLACPVLAIPKSRQIMMSWSLCAYAVWHARTSSHREVIFQSKKEQDANEMVSRGDKNPMAGRMDFIEQHLPGWLADPYVICGVGNQVGQLAYTPVKRDRGTGLLVPWHGSSIHAVPQGADQVRGKTPSLYISDEAAYQEEFGPAVVALMPAVTGGGQFVAVSSVSAGSHFNTMVREDYKDSRHGIPEKVKIGMRALGLGDELPPGMRSWLTPSGVWVLEVHYKADPDKSPDCEHGRAWLGEAVKAYMGGFESSGWRAEMEIDYGAGGGDPVFPFLANPAHKIFARRMPVEEVRRTMALYAGYDYGTRNPSAFVVVGVDKDKNLHLVWELYEPCLNVRLHCAKIKACPYWEDIRYIKCDPSIHAKTQQTARGLRSIAELFAERGIHLDAGRRGQDVAYALRMLGEYWSDPDSPKAFLHVNCPNAIREHVALRWDEHKSEAVSLYTNNPEKIRQKDNHTVDAMAVVLDSMPTAFVSPFRKAGVGSFEWADKMLDKKARESRYAKEYVHV